MSVEDVNKEVLEYLIGALRYRLSDVSDDAEKMIFDDDFLTNALRLSLSAFNSYPPCTYFSLADDEFCKYHADVLVSYAAYITLSGAALKERGREFSVTDNGIGYTPPGVSDMAWQQALVESGQWERRIEKIKNSYSFGKNWLDDDERSFPEGGSITIMAGKCS